MRKRLESNGNCSLSSNLVVCFGPTGRSVVGSRRASELPSRTHCQKPSRRCYFEKTLALPTSGTMFSRTGRGCRSRSNASLRACGSIQILTAQFFFVAMAIRLTQGAGSVTLLMIPLFHVSYCRFMLWFNPHCHSAACYCSRTCRKLDHKVYKSGQ